ncbi:hypothetical protein HJC23_008205 [Cyclotella cryptica]|uniref:Ammonium transporter n=1 Tax=Cyclotella cryptica TaxID=29204 RepID=A0ABD3NWX3_9STRA|eukprot:CCRYP_019364-RA/>CCRYP_019364-RA protein AED:0.21 eAED:0.21 QI:195/1/1/1/1/1/2/84/532
MTSNSVYEACKSALSISDTSKLSLQEAVDRQEQLLECTVSSNADSINSFFLIFASALVFFMQAGFAMLCAGCVQKKNIQNTMLKNLLDVCGAALGFYTVGYAFAYGGSYGESTGSNKTFIGTSNFFLAGVDDVMFWVFQFAFSASCATIVAGTLAERCQMTAYVMYSIVLTGFVYPVVVHSIWSPQGFLSAHASSPLWGSGFVDFAGSTVVHFTGGFTALIAAYMLGPRRGRFYDDRGKLLITPNPMPGHSSALQVLGVFILWFGWYGFNVGSAVSITGPGQPYVMSLAAVNTTLSPASACLSAIIVNYFLAERKTGEGEFSLKASINGCLSGLVAITGPCAVVEPWAAIIIGLLAGPIYLLSSEALVRFRIDDAVDAIPVHMFNGIFGSIAVAFLASPSRLELVYGHSDHAGLFYSGDGTLLAAQVCGLLFVLAWVAALMTPFFLLLNKLGWFRTDAITEITGLDQSYHGAANLDADDHSLGPKPISPFQRTIAGPNVRVSVLDNSNSDHGSRFNVRTSTLDDSGPPADGA